LTAIVTDQVFRIPSIAIADRKAAQHAAPVYMYLFEFETSALGGRLKSSHGLEISFVFDTVRTEPFAGTDNRRFALADRMSAAWSAFARTGDPNHGDLPRWPVYDTTDRSTMILNATCSVLSDPERERRLIWQRGR